MTVYECGAKFGFVLTNNLDKQYGREVSNNWHADRATVSGRNKDKNTGQHIHKESNKCRVRKVSRCGRNTY